MSLSLCCEPGTSAVVDNQGLYGEQTVFERESKD